MRRQAILLISIVILLLSQALTANAQQTFCVYLNDGSVRFFNTAEVDSITYSRIGLNGIDHEDYVVQEIYTPDSKHRIPLEEIDGVSFIMPKRDVETLKSVHEGVDKIFSACATIDEMSKHLDEIKAMKGIAEAWTTDDALYVRTNDGFISFWLYPNDIPMSEEVLLNAAKQVTRSATNNESPYHTQLTPKKIAVINQQSSDESRDFRIPILKRTMKEFNKAGFTDVRYIDQKEAGLIFFASDITNYDIVFLSTHGGYFGGNHWILTGTDASITNLSEVKDIYIGTIEEIRGNKKVPIKYYAINENFIRHTMQGKFDDAIIFNIACHSLQGSNSLAAAFLGKGAKTYIGYNQSACQGVNAGHAFFNYILTGMTAGQAYKKMADNDLQYYYHYVYDFGHENHPNATLKIVGDKDVCIIHPHVEVNGLGEITTTTAEINGEIYGWAETLDKENSKVGLFYSTKMEDILNLDNINRANSCSTSVASCNFSKEGPLTFNGKMENLSPNTTYYYRPFLYMNGEYYYGEECALERIMTYLVKLYNDTDGDHWSDNYDWLSIASPEFWYGVKDLYDGVDDMDLYEINLNSNNLKGTIDLSGCTSIKRLQCSYNNLTSIDVSGCTALEELDCGFNNLTSLNVSGCTALKKLDCGFNNLTSIDVSGCTALEEISWGFNDNSVTHLDVSGCTALKELNCSSLDNLTSIDVSGCTALKKLHCNLLENLTSIDVSGCTALEELDCTFNNLTTLDVSGCTALKELDCISNNLTSLNVLGCTAFEKLSCHHNNLTTLDVSGCTALKELDCGSNNLTSLNVLGCIALEKLDCIFNNLASLDVSGYTALKELDCGYNNLTTLDVSGCTALEKLDYAGNNLTSLDVSGCTALEKLDYTHNNLTSLDVSGCTALKELDCGYNNLTTLYVSGCTALKKLNCESNNLSSLNVSGCNALQELDCDNNKLTSLSVSGCTALKYLNCRNNQIISEVPQSFKNLRSFSHDQLYSYYYDDNLEEYTYKRNEYGWYYPGEPESGKHAWP